MGVVSVSRVARGEEEGNEKAEEGHARAAALATIPLTPFWKPVLRSLICARTRASSAAFFLGGGRVDWVNTPCRRCEGGEA